MNEEKEIDTSWEVEKLRICYLRKKPNKKRKRSVLRKTEWRMQLLMPNKKRKRSLQRKDRVENANINGNIECNKLCADVMNLIFIRCTVSTLSMLKCASKSWNDYITTPLFVHSHMKHSTGNTRVLFVKSIPPKLKIPRDIKRVRLQFISVDMQGKGDINELYSITLPDHEFRTYYSGMIASYGLLCISSSRGRIYLCNPVMKQLRKLPKCSPNDIVYYIPSTTGFGYHHSTKEYKVVNFFYTCAPWLVPYFAHHKFCQLRCEVFTFTSLTNGQVWKEIAETPPFHPHGRGLLVKECMYWLAKPNIPDKPDRILSLDLENGKFLTISFPSSVTKVSVPSLMELKGMLCVPNRGKSLDLWILKDKISCSWVKEYSISFVNYDPRYILPIFRAWNEGIIFIYKDVMVFHDLKRNCDRASTIGFEMAREDDWFQNYNFVFGFEIYQESLFSL